MCVRHAREPGTLLVSLPVGGHENIHQAESRSHLPLPYSVDRPSTDCMSPTPVGEDPVSKCSRHLHIPSRTHTHTHKPHLTTSLGILSPREDTRKERSACQGSLRLCRVHKVGTTLLTSPLLHDTLRPPSHPIPSYYPGFKAFPHVTAVFCPNNTQPGSDSGMFSSLWPLLLSSVLQRRGSS